MTNSFGLLNFQVLVVPESSSKSVIGPVFHYTFPIIHGSIDPYLKIITVYVYCEADQL